MSFINIYCYYFFGYFWPKLDHLLRKILTLVSKEIGRERDKNHPQCLFFSEILFWREVKVHTYFLHKKKFFFTTYIAQLLFLTKAVPRSFFKQYPSRILSALSFFVERNFTLLDLWPCKFNIISERKTHFANFYDFGRFICKIMGERIDVIFWKLWKFCGDSRSLILLG